MEVYKINTREDGPWYPINREPTQDDLPDIQDRLVMVYLSYATRAIACRPGYSGITVAS